MKPPMTTQEMIDALVKALEAGNYKAAPPDYYTEYESWRPDEKEEPKPKKDEKYPHKCPKCGGPAYVGFSSVDCKNKCR